MQMRNLKYVPSSKQIVNLFPNQNAKGSAGYEPHVQQKGRCKYCLGHRGSVTVNIYKRCKINKHTYNLVRGHSL